jgi:hypothetical protein
MKPVRKVRGYWEPHEIEVLRQVYPMGGPEAVKEKLPHRNLSAISEKCHTLGIYISEEVSAQRRAEAARRTMNMKKAADGDVTPPEYLQAADIFQVGYRIAKDMGVVHEYA